MNSKSDVNRRVLVIQAKKKRHKPNKKKNKTAANNAVVSGGGGGGPANLPDQETGADSIVSSNIENDAPIIECELSCDVKLRGEEGYKDDAVGSSGSSSTTGGTAPPAGKKQKSIKNKVTASSSFTTTNSENSLNFSMQKNQMDLNMKLGKLNSAPPPHSSSNDSNQSEVNSDFDEEQELEEDYCFGGYHPVKIGDLYHGKLFGFDKQCCLFSSLSDWGVVALGNLID